MAYFSSKSQAKEAMVNAMRELVDLRRDGINLGSNVNPLVDQFVTGVIVGHSNFKFVNPPRTGDNPPKTAAFFVSKQTLIDAGNASTDPSSERQKAIINSLIADHGMTTSQANSVVNPKDAKTKAAIATLKKQLSELEASLR